MAEMHLEQAYMLRQKYLDNLKDTKKYTSELNPINEKTSSKKIAEYINQELSKPAQTESQLSIKRLYEQIDSIVYLSQLSYYYVNKVNVLDVFNKKKIINRLIKTSELAEKRQRLLSNDLQTFIKSLSEKDTDAENLINHEIKYLKTVYSSELSSEAKDANDSYLKIDIKKIKTQSEKDYIKLEELFKKYKHRCSEEVEMTDMSKTKNGSFAKEEENKSTDSGHCSDDDASSYHTAPGDPDEQTIDTKIPTQAPVYLEEPNKPTAPTKHQDKPTVHTEVQKQNPPHKESLLAQIWGLIKKIWQKIKNIFKNSEKNHEDNTFASYSASKQRVTLTFNIKEIPAQAKGYQTLDSTEADNQSQEPESAVFRPR